MDKFAYFFIKTYVVDVHWNHLVEAIHCNEHPQRRFVWIFSFVSGFTSLLTIFLSFWCGFLGLTPTKQLG